MGCKEQGMKMADGINRCTEKCALLHSFMGKALLVHGF